MLFNLFRRANINQGVEDYKNTKNAVLVDVRTKEEYEEGHIPNSINVDLYEIEKIQNVITDKTVPLFVYCHSGARSNRATNILRKLGYENVSDVCGIASYKGEIIKGA